MKYEDFPAAGNCIKMLDFLAKNELETIIAITSLELLVAVYRKGTSHEPDFSEN